MMVTCLQRVLIGIRHLVVAEDSEGKMACSGYTECQKASTIKLFSAYSA